MRFHAKLIILELLNLRQLRNHDRGQNQCVAFDVSGVHSIWQHCSVMAQRPVGCAALTSHDRLGAGEESAVYFMTDSSQYRGCLGKHIDSSTTGTKAGPCGGHDPQVQVSWKWLVVDRFIDAWALKCTLRCNAMSPRLV